MNSSSPACLSFPGPALLPSVLVELHGSINFKENLCEFSAGSFKVIIFGKLLRFNDSYGVSCLTAATQMQLFWRTLYLLMSRPVAYLGFGEGGQSHRREVRGA